MSPAPPDLALSLVVPLYNEAAVLDELEARCRAAVAPLGDSVEILLVDDHSTDGSDARLAAMAPPVRHLRLPRNLGQWGGTTEGLRRARGETVVVMDGDLQDPPELVPRLQAALLAAPDADVAFATRERRDDPLWFRAGRRGYRALQFAVAAGHTVPPRTGSFCAMRAPVARRAAAVSLPDANLAAVLTALRVRHVTVPCERSARADGSSRVGLAGLSREALGSLLLLSPLGRRWLPDE